MNKNSRIYIAGHRGLVGSALLRKLRERGYQNLISKRSSEVDLRRQRDVEDFFQQEKPEYVFLAAAKVGGILANSTYKAEFIYDNLMIAANVVNASYRNGVKKLLNLGSSCIYPKFAPQPMKEDHLLTGILEPTNEPYAIAKISAIKLCRYYNEQYGTDFMSVMPTNLYGINDNFNLETSHVLPALIRKMHLGKCLQNGDMEAVRADLRRFPQGGSNPEKMSDGEVITLLKGFGIESLDPLPLTPHASTVSVALWGSGEPYREFLYVDDLADACLFLMEKHDSRTVGEFVNIGTGEDIRIKDLAELIGSIVGFEGELRRDASKPDGTPRKLLDVSKMMSLGWKARTSLEEGIRKTYEWYIS